MSSSFCLSVAPRHADMTTRQNAPRREIIASARDISLDSILRFNRTRFYVASQSHPETFYFVDFDSSTCNCQDFQRIQFCKHIAAIHFHFPYLFDEEGNPTIPPEYPLVPDKHQSNINSDSYSNPESALAPTETIQTLVRETNLLCRILVSEIEKLDPSLASTSRHYQVAIEALRSAKYFRMVAIASMKGTSLPNQQLIAPHQTSWGETAAGSGVKRAPKRKCLPEERGITERLIGTIAKGKRRRTNSDPYAGGKCSGKRVKSDVPSMETNRARACPYPYMCTSLCNCIHFL